MLTMIVLLLLGFPMMIPLIAGATVGFLAMFGGLGQVETMVQQILAGIRPASLIAVPMFIFAADIMTRGQSAGRLIDMVMAFVGHVKGGLAVSTAAACTMFGAVSGSTQATVVAVGSPLRPRMLKAGYNDSFVLALIVNSSRHRLPDPALDRHDHLWRGIEHLDRRAVHRRHRSRAADPGAVFDLLGDLRHPQQRADRAEGRPGPSGFGRCRWRSGRSASRRSSSAASTAASSARPRRRRPACSTR